MNEGYDVCRSNEVRTTCPVACGANVNCWSGEELRTANESQRLGARTIWTRIMRLDVESGVGAATCLAEGVVDPSAQCRRLRASNDSRYRAATATTPDRTWSGFLQYVTQQNPATKLRDIRDCDLLAASIQPGCSFTLDPTFTSLSDQVISREGQLTISWWMRSRDNTITDFKPALSIMSSLAPPYPLLVVSSYGPDALAFNLFNRCHPLQRTSAQHTVALPSDQWVHFAVSLGVLAADGTIQMSAMVNSQLQFKEIINWCVPDDLNIRSLVEGVVLNDNVMISPIELRTGDDALTIKELQQRFYRERSFYQHRAGPREADAVRLGGRLPYDTQRFVSPLALMAPPMISQTRALRSAACPYAFAESFRNWLWSTAVERNVICDSSHECTAQLQNSSLALLACNALDDSPVTHFGFPSGRLEQGR